MADSTLVIDGSQGEGGGQILRSALSLAVALGKNVAVTGIRAGRQRTGLRPQHLAAVRAAAAVCGAEVEGDRIGSPAVAFRPGPVRAGRYQFTIGTAGSALLLCQTLLPPLLLAEGASEVTVFGGTHNPLAPCLEYVRDVFGVLASAGNLQAYFEMLRPGFAPAGAGEVHMQVAGVGAAEFIAPLRFRSRGELKYIEGLSAAARPLPERVVEDQSRQVLGRLAAAGHRATMEQAMWEAASPGCVVFLRAAFSRSVAGFFALGRKGRPAEKVADEAVDALLAFLDSDGVVDAHAADQLIVLAALAPEESAFRTERVTAHLLTNAAVVRQMTGRDVRITGELGRPGDVVVRPM